MPQVGAELPGVDSVKAGCGIATEGVVAKVRIGEAEVRFVRIHIVITRFSFQTMSLVRGSKAQLEI